MMLGDLEPVSRVFLDGDGYDDDDIEDPPVEKAEWIFQTEHRLPKTFNTLLIVDNKPAKEFALQTVVHGLVPYCSYGKDKTMEMYKMPNADLYVCLADKYQETVSGTMTQDLKPWLEAARRVVCITFTSFVFYLNTDKIEESPCCIRALHTDFTEDSEMLDTTILATPNYMRGLSAGVLTYRQFMNLSGSIYCCYLDSKTIDSMNTADVTKLFHDLKIPCRPFRTVYKQDNNLFL